MTSLSTNSIDDEMNSENAKNLHSGISSGIKNVSSGVSREVIFEHPAEIKVIKPLKFTQTRFKSNFSVTKSELKGRLMKYTELKLKNKKFMQSNQTKTKVRRMHNNTLSVSLNFTSSYNLVLSLIA